MGRPNCLCEKAIWKETNHALNPELSRYLALSAFVGKRF
jgi:hypothetical protein